MTIYRPITENDLDEVYAHPEAEKWLIPTYRTREYAEAVECDCQMAIDGEMKLYSFPYLHPLHQPEAYYIFTVDDAMLAFYFKKFQGNKRIYEIVFLSEELKMEVGKYIAQIQQIFIEGGEYLFANPDNLWTEAINNADFVDTENNKLNDDTNIEEEK